MPAGDAIGRHADGAGIRRKIKEVISNVTSIPAGEIADRASFVEDLHLDSLALLEIGVDIDYEFQLQLQDLEERLGQLPTVEHVARLVEEHLRGRQA